MRLLRQLIKDLKSTACYRGKRTAFLPRPKVTFRYQRVSLLTLHTSFLPTTGLRISPSYFGPWRTYRTRKLMRVYHVSFTMLAYAR